MIEIGQKASFKKTITKKMLNNYADLSGDYNLIHFDESYAKDTMFKGTIVHGMLYASFISKVLGMDLPGPGSIYIEQNLKFVYPVRLNDEITATVSVKNINEKNICELETICINQNKKMVIEGYARIKLPENH